LVVETRDQRQQQILAADAKGNTRMLLAQQDRAWLDPIYTWLRWLPDGQHFLTASEASGVAGLELHDASGRDGRPVAGSSPLWDQPVLLDSGAVLVVATPTPTESEVRRLTTAESPGVPRTILAAGLGDRSVVAASGSGHYAITESTLNAMPVTTVYAPDGHKIGVLPSVAEQPRAWPKPELGWLDMGHDRFYYAIVKPRNFNPCKHYPVIDSVYGGPTSNMVTARALDYLRDQWLADHGAIVVRIDNRGTPRRNRDWARAFKDADGQHGDALSVIVNDQAAVLQALAARFPQLDIDRVGITGWSYGGTSSVAAVTLRPDVFKVAVAGAPVTDWRDYDTYYTERYLDTPEVNAEGYAKSDLVARAAELTRPLLLIHGTGDDNVYFSHSLKLADALFRAGKPFEFLPLINFTHMVPDALVQQRLQGRIAEFLFGHLGGPQ
jgi:dipeptidyl-peptidase 4